MEQAPVLMAGKCITGKNDPLHKVTVDYLYYAIRKPRSDIAGMIGNLRSVQSIDPGRYRELKKQLPYVVSAVFHPNYRRTEHFAFSNCFILDMDHLHRKETSPQTVKELIRQDPRVMMAFVSPGGDGLKILFGIDQRVTDPVKFMIFYKNFAADFSGKYHLDQVVDRQTSDVTRACFISFDEEVLYNPGAVPVVFDEWFDEKDGLLPLKTRKMLKENKPDRKEAPAAAEEEKKDLPKALYDEIRKTLNPNARVSRPKQIYVPEEMEKITDRLTERLQEHGITVREIINIHYGKKFIFTYDRFFAEVNVFYGKKGFTVVRSMKKGSNPDLLEAGFAIVSDFFYGGRDALAGLLDSVHKDNGQDMEQQAGEKNDKDSPF